MSDETMDETIPGDLLRTLGDRLKLLEGIIGHQVPARYFVQKDVAAILGIDAPGWNKRLNGTNPTRPMELAKLVDLYKLGPEVDFTIFEETSRDRFLARLKDAQVGTYGASALTLLCNRLRRAAGEPQNKANRVKLQTYRSRETRGGVGRPRGEPIDRSAFGVGDAVRAVCMGPASKALVLLNATINGRVWLLTPTDYAPLAYSQQEPLVVPDDLSDPFEIQRPSEQYYLYALWTDADTASLFQHVERHEDELTDNSARTLLRRLDAIKEPLAAAAFNYAVGR